MSVLCDIHQQVFSKHWDILQQFQGFVWVCAVFFKIIFICQSGKFLLENRILHLNPKKPHKNESGHNLVIQLQLHLLSINNFLATYLVIII